mmetsp:Transcript_30194/g.85273  ORF Transcript_30194/g.85273 Transcript_30194/m.85273 type:complete len:798 (-) Transcript_30194:182-2575(-)|eukprot:CAMPEP_0117656440 /NCGR_PEP_ID=MMETSP0804-20121206/4805_1 /TAXON_ID=1074897 /ORGANISM="Tetraselmis astigmatica, Strain CCMP880" /LENGTH=797 /DNA_ID=CAMNT_0005462841 /DNA_START=174 /DNA_END=2567 /DNA_ORIENTATION=+
MRLLLLLLPLLLCVCTFLPSFLQAAKESSVHDVYAWGRNNAGQLGLVNFQEQHKPALVSLLKGKRVQSLAAGGSETVDGHTLAIVTPGKLFAAGDNTYGQLGSGDHSDRDNFIPVAALYHLEVAQTSAGEMHSLALTTTGEVYAWGSNAHGQLGLDDPRTEFSLPQLVKIELFGSEKVAGVCAGYQHSLAWTTQGTVWSWGDNTYGQLGTDDKKPRQAPSQVKLHEGLHVSRISCGAHHAVLVTDSGSLYAWGRNKAGQLGLDSPGSKDVSRPTALPSLAAQGSKPVQVSCGAAHSVVLTEHGSLWSFGDNSLGQLGIGGSLHSKHSPREVKPPGSSGWKAVAAGRAHTLALTESQAVYAWGQGLMGQLGLGDTTQRGEPTGIISLGASKVTALGAGSATSFAITADGEVWGWGKNNVGQMGLRATKTPKVVPEVVLRNQEVSRIRQLAAGGYAYMYEGHSAVLSSSGELVVWGWNAFGQLGLGEISVGNPIPQRNVWLLKQHVRQVAAGQFATAAVTDAGEVFSWGLNEAGQLGKGDFSSSAVEVPQRIHIDAHIVSVSVGYAHMLALSEDGRVYAWGRNFYGQLGVGDHKDKPSPQLISYLQEEQIVEVQAGQYHSLAVSARGDIFAWGYNREYELGVGDNMDRVLPQAIPSLQGKQIVSAAACGYHSMAVTADGHLYAWGLNNYGQLGQPSRKEQAVGKVPQLVQLQKSDGAGKEKKVKLLDCGSWHSVAVTTDGELYSWGRCNMGQLGIGSKCGKSGRVDSPERVRDFAHMKVESVACGASHTLAVVVASSDE